jgi:hypothetical protein
LRPLEHFNIENTQAAQAQNAAVHLAGVGETEFRR